MPDPPNQGGQPRGVLGARTTSLPGSKEKPLQCVDRGQVGKLALGSHHAVRRQQPCPGRTVRGSQLRQKV